MFFGGGWKQRLSLRSSSQLCWSNWNSSFFIIIIDSQSTWVTMGPFVFEMGLTVVSMGWSRCRGWRLSIEFHHQKGISRSISTWFQQSIVFQFFVLSLSISSISLSFVQRHSTRIWVCKIINSRILLMKARLSVSMVNVSNIDDAMEHTQVSLVKMNMPLIIPFPIRGSVLVKTQVAQFTSFPRDLNFTLFNSNPPSTSTLSRANNRSTHPCRHPINQCQQLMSNKSLFICLYRTNFHGENCSRRDHRCDRGYCAEGSPCQPNSRGSSAPFCLCPLNCVGHQCESKHDGCFFLALSPRWILFSRQSTWSRDLCLCERIFRICIRMETPFNSFICFTDLLPTSWCSDSIFENWFHFSRSSWGWGWGWHKTW